MRLRAACGMAALFVLMPSAAALAGCGLREQPSKSVQVEGGTTSDSLTGNHGNWAETYLLVVARDGNRRSFYGRAASDQRFAKTDTVYEGGAYVAASPHVILNVVGSFSPQHQTLPQSTIGGGFDDRTGGGYGFQLQYSARTYSAVNAATVTTGFDRYFRDRRVALNVSFSQLSNVPGTAVSAGVQYARFLPCDSQTLSVSSGRDVESTGVGSALAVFRTYSYDVNELHWFTPHLGANLGAGWYLLNGAYSRFEVRLALHARL